VICDVVIDCLGRELVVISAYPDGSYNCPSCGYGVRPEEPHCQNPCCYTRPGFPAETARQWEAEREARKAAELERARNAEANRRAHEEYKRDREAAIVAALAEAKRKGACSTCTLYSFRHGGPVKYTKHRGICPRADGAA
jgi:hypothetical protein